MNEFKDKKIMLIDDDPDLLDLMVGFFRPRGAIPMTFGTAEEALNALLVHKLRPDAIVIDLNLPGISGIEFTKKLAQLGQPPPIFVMTATSSLDMAVAAIDAGASDFLVKPIQFAQLQISLGRALRLHRLESDNARLRTIAKGVEGDECTPIGKSKAWKIAVDLSKRVSSGTANVLITGESGTGKEVIARLIHQSGPRRNQPFIAINCAAIPENLLESEFFGHAKGSFTGAIDRKVGLFEEADGGVLFLDEIGDLSLPLQAKVLRAIQERSIKRLGENQNRKIDIHLIAATHKNLRQEVADKKFREDLFFRLNVIPIFIPPLRERREDIPPLAEHFLKKFALIHGSIANEFSKEALQHLYNHDWHGNVRELANVIERATILTRQPIIDVSDLMFESDKESETNQKADDRGIFQIPRARGTLLPLRELEAQYFAYALKVMNGSKENAAKALGIDRKTLYRRLKEDGPQASENPSS